MTLSIVSYNMQGHGAGHLEYVNDLVNGNDIVLLQEHWYSNSNISSLYNALENSVIYGISGMPDDEIICGRPYGGTAIVCNKSLLCKVVPINTTSKRLCVVKLSLPEPKVSIIIVSVYMPTDTYYDKTNLGLFEQELNVIKQVCNEQDAHYVIVGGDFNTDLSRSNSLHTKALSSFMESENMVPLIRFTNNNVDYTYESKITYTRSLIDHIVVSESMLESAISLDAIHEGHNLSDHSPLVAKFGISTQHVSVENDTPVGNAFLQWRSANDCQLICYKQMLDNELSKITIPLDAIQCKDYFCNQHVAEIECFHDSIVNACLKAGECTIPSPSSGSVRRAGWNDLAKPYKDEAISWHKMWKLNNSPHSGFLSDMRKVSRARYHYAIRSLKKNSDDVTAIKLAENLVLNKSKDFWQEVRKMKGVKAHLANTVDDITGEDNICDLFSEKYETLLNSVSYNVDEMSCILNSIDNNIMSSCCNNSCHSNHVICTSEVIDAIKELKPNKSDGNEGCQSDHLIHGTCRLHVLLSQLFTCMLKHGYAPESFLLSTITSIPKNKRKSLNDSNNYRGIALSSILGKVFDWVIMKKNKEILNTSDLQFGFKPNHSTTQSTFVIDEVTQHYINNGSDVYVMLLDASQAFDRVNYCKLFKLLLKKGLCPITCRFLAYSYTKQLARTKWGKNVSEPFKVTNGVKQGGVLSPILFTVYVDELICCLKSTGVGCYIGRSFFGASGYADDLSLLCPTKTALSIMLKVAHKFSNEYDIKFNPTKCQLVVVGPNGHVNDSVSFNGIVIKSDATAAHLGSIIGYDVCEKRVQRSINDIIVHTNSIASVFFKADIDVKYKLFKCYSMSLYGCPLWDLTHKSVLHLFTTWRKCIRKISGLPSRTHCDLLPLICCDLPVPIQLYQRFMKFLHTALNSSNDCVKTCALLALNGSCSSACNNINHIAKMLNISKYKLVNQKLNVIHNSLHKLHNPKVEDLITAAQVKDLLFLSLVGHEHFSRAEFVIMLDYLCCS